MTTREAGATIGLSIAIVVFELGSVLEVGWSAITLSWVLLVEEGRDSEEVLCFFNGGSIVVGREGLVMLGEALGYSSIVSDCCSLSQCNLPSKVNEFTFVCCISLVVKLKI